MSSYQEVSKVKAIWLLAIDKGILIPLTGVVVEDCITTLSNELCGLNDTRLYNSKYPERHTGRKDLSSIFVKYFQLVKLTRDELFQAGILPTCAYVGEFAMWHKRDMDSGSFDGSHIFPKVSNHVLPQIDPETRLPLYGVGCNRRIARACECVTLLDTWLEYYACGGDTSSIISAQSIIDTLTILPKGYFTDAEKTERFVQCYGLQWKDEQTGQYAQITNYKVKEVLEKPTSENGLHMLANLKDVIERLAKVRACFLLPLTDTQERSVRAVTSEVTELYAKVESVVLEAFQKKIEGLRADFTKNC